MKTKFIKLALVTVLLSGCNDNFLEVIPVSERTVVNFYKTPADFNNAVVGTYATFKNGGLYGNGTGSLIWLGETVTDNAEFGSTRQPVNISSFEIDDLNFSLANGYFSSAWIGHYAGIARANGILDRISTVDFEAPLKDQYEGEARFLRAMFYFNLVRLFGEVPLVTSEINDPYDASNLTRSPVAEVYTLIESDLKIAEAKLSDIITGANAGRASKWAAKALLGKVFLTLKQFDKAAPKLKEIIDDNKFSLMPNYADVFAASTSFAANKEIMLAVQYKSGQIGQGGAFYSSWLPFNVNVPEFGVIGGVGGGVNRPTVDLVAAYENGDLRKAASLVTSYNTAQGIAINERYAIKFRQVGIIANDSDVDFPILRYADVLLMYAEALNETGNIPEALKYLNMVRRRAFGFPIDTVTPQPNDLAGLDPAGFHLAIEQERRLELAFESHRWFDLVRTGRFVEVMKAKEYNVMPHHVLFPIPQRELELNPGLGQNRGYN